MLKAQAKSLCAEEVACKAAIEVKTENKCVSPAVRLLLLVSFVEQLPDHAGAA